MRIMIGRIIAILALAPLFFSYSNFALIALIAIRLSFRVDTIKQ